MRETAGSETASGEIRRTLCPPEWFATAKLLCVLSSAGDEICRVEVRALFALQCI